MKHLLIVLIFLGLVVEGTAGILPVRVTGSRVNLRAKPGLNFEVVGQSERDAILLAKTFQTEWVEVIPPSGTKAYVYSAMVRDNLVAVDELNVRSGPGINYSPIGRLKRNMLVVVTGSFGDEWLEIDAPADCSLWVSADYVEPTRPLAPAAPIPEIPVEVEVPIVATPLPDLEVAGEPELVDSRGHLLPATVHLVPLAGQGRKGSCTGILTQDALVGAPDLSLSPGGDPR